MNLIALKSALLNPGDDLISAIGKALSRKKEKLKNGDILAIASKAVAFSQNRLEKAGNEKEFRALVRREADVVLEDGEMVITLKNGILIPNAGIDRSNTPEGMAVMWPKEPFTDARKIRKELMKKSDLKKFGILITDSHCQPLRLGTSGIAIGWDGFIGVEDMRGAKDLFGKKMNYTQISLADDLSSAANILMGETDASVPFVIIRGLNVRWTEKKSSKKDYFISPEEDIYKSFHNKKL